MPRAPKEPLSAAPFLRWCAEREERIEADLNSYPCIPGGNNLPVQDRLIAELGWDGETGMRRLYRWRSEAVTGLVERALIEDALHHAGVEFTDIYPDEDVPSADGDAYCSECVRKVTAIDGHCAWCQTPVTAAPKGSMYRVGQGRHMTNDQVRAAHKLYDQAGMSCRQIAVLLWERFGYANVEACYQAVQRGFVNLDLPRRDVREASRAAHWKHGLYSGGKAAPMTKRTLHIAAHGQCEGVRKDGTRCPRAAQSGTSTCGYHAPAEMERRRQQVAAINARRAVAA